MLTPVHRQKHQQWSREHQNWTTEQWKKVAWSDETCFLLHHVDGRVHVCRLPGEHMAPGCTMGRRQAGGGSVMLWPMFCWETLGPAIHVDTEGSWKQAGVEQTRHYDTHRRRGDTRNHMERWIQLLIPPEQADGFLTCEGYRFGCEENLPERFSSYRVDLVNFRRNCSFELELATEGTGDEVSS
ncbi:Transposable element Tc1 transposase [Anabarilius grahami]|uniref:Transposable element Tc1 transposase n=1 Tax=Anabarilius grahami TaxID=495550 RepID=A0A3N0ZBG8_ANAGA|nr:Transposable element Tc1 transposase [Anabarilius grahami]